MAGLLDLWNTTRSQARNGRRGGFWLDDAGDCESFGASGNQGSFNVEQSSIA